MENEVNIINYGMWIVPEKWEDIDLKTYQDIERYYDENGDKFDIRDVIHILCGKSKDEVNELPMEFLEKIMEKLMFLQESPKEKEATNKVVISGETYMINVMNKLKTGEYVSAESVLKADKHNYAAILAILCRKEGEKYDSKFEAEVFDKRVEMFEGVPITDILAVVAFFFELYIRSEIPSKLYMAVEEAVDHIQQNIESSQKIGAWKRSYLKWQITKLRKSLESSKNI